MKVSKTVVFFALTLLVALAGLFGFSDYAPSKEQADLILAIISIVGIALRAVTSTPLFPKE